MRGKDTGISIDDVGVLVATYCEKQAVEAEDFALAGGAQNAEPAFLPINVSAFR